MSSRKFSAPTRRRIRSLALLLAAAVLLGSCSLPGLRDDYMGKSLLQKEKTIRPPVRRDAWGNPVLPSRPGQ